MEEVEKDDRFWLMWTVDIMILWQKTIISAENSRHRGMQIAQPHHNVIFAAILQ